MSTINFDSINTKEKSGIRIRKGKILDINQRGKNVMTDANSNLEKNSFSRKGRILSLAPFDLGIFLSWLGSRKYTQYLFPVHFPKLFFRVVYVLSIKVGIKEE